jgi:hypothetical protein
MGRVLHASRLRAGALMNDVRNRVGDFFTAPESLALLDRKRRACRFTRRDHSAAVMSIGLHKQP